MIRRASVHLMRVAVAAVAVAVVSASAFGQESWDAIYIQGTKVGHMHTRVEPVKDRSGRELNRVRCDWVLELRRGQDVAKMSLMYGTIETKEGEVLRLDTRTEAGGGVIRTYGNVEDGKMPLILETNGQREQKLIDWPADVRGPYGAELSLARAPLAPGESRQVKTYIPDLNRVCVTHLTAKGMETVEIGGRGQSRQLLCIESVVKEPDGTPVTSMASTLWVDESGQIMKSRTDLLGGMLTYRTTKEAATGPTGIGNFNLLTDLVVKSPRRMTNAERTRNVVYRISVPDSEPATLFPNDRRQSVRPSESTSVATLEVKTAGPTDGAAEAAADLGPFLRPNPLVDSADARVIAHMRAAVGARTDPWEKAKAIQDWVANNLKEKNFGVAFAPAAQVARDLAGDCSEHSVLVAAMCRAAGVPARCVVGLVYADDIGGRRGLSGFGPHMWNEVYVNQRWVAIDAAYNQSEVDATHLKLADTSLDGVAPFEAFLPVLRISSSMKIDPMEIR